MKFEHQAEHSTDTTLSTMTSQRYNDDKCIINYVTCGKIPIKDRREISLLDFNCLKPNSIKYILFLSSCSDGNCNTTTLI